MQQLNKKQILKIVKKMRFYWYWSTFFNTDFGPTNLGFCYFLDLSENLTCSQKDDIINELYIDLINIKKFKINRDYFWYEKFNKTNYFKQRLEHINRTINRLKKEINNESN